jgi:hypothetical protein
MHAFDEIKMLKNENEQLKKIIQDYPEVKKIFEENEQLKKEIA